MLGKLDIYNCYAFLLDWSLDHYVATFLISCNVLYFKFHFVCYEYYYSSFLLLPICKEYIFPSSHFPSTCVSKPEMGFWYTVYIEVLFYIHLASLCLLVGTFNPFMFKVIIDIYVPVAIVLIIWGWFCRSFFLLLYFLTV